MPEPLPQSYIGANQEKPFIFGLVHIQKVTPVLPGLLIEAVLSLESVECEDSAIPFDFDAYVDIRITFKT